MKIIEAIYNCETGEETFVEHELTPEETNKRLEYAKEIETELAELAAKEAARQALLDKLGITADEAKLLLG
jgi:phosphopantetheinyl transferase (holo-ACP synthase)